jgi:hypothetical protein
MTDDMYKATKIDINVSSLVFSLARLNAGDPYLCHYCMGGSSEISSLCRGQNDKKRTSIEKEKNLYPFCFPGGSHYPGKFI